MCDNILFMLHSNNLYYSVCLCACVCALARVCVRLCVEYIFSIYLWIISNHFLCKELLFFLNSGGIYETKVVASFVTILFVTSQIKNLSQRRSHIDTNFYIPCQYNDFYIVDRNYYEFCVFDRSIVDGSFFFGLEDFACSFSRIQDEMMWVVTKSKCFFNMFYGPNSKNSRNRQASLLVIS